jgi:hypothetical protein
MALLEPLCHVDLHYHTQIGRPSNVRYALIQKDGLSICLQHLVEIAYSTLSSMESVFTDVLVLVKVSPKTLYILCRGKSASWLSYLYLCLL